MAEQTQLQQVTVKDPKKVEEDKRVAECNRRKKEENAQPTKAQSESKLSQYYGDGAHCSHWDIRCSWLLHLPIQENS